VRVLHAVGSSGVNDHHVSVGPVGDPHFAAAQLPSASHLLRARFHRQHVRARLEQQRSATKQRRKGNKKATHLRLGHGEGADEVAAHEAREIALLLLLGAVAMNLVDAEVGVGAVGEADAARGPADLLHHHRVLRFRSAPTKTHNKTKRTEEKTHVQIAQAQPSVLGVHRHAQHAQLAQLLPHLPRKLIALVNLGS
jgi:hypothetical protein